MILKALKSKNDLLSHLIFCIFIYFVHLYLYIHTLYFAVKKVDISIKLYISSFFNSILLGFISFVLQIYKEPSLSCVACNRLQKPFENKKNK